MDRLSAEEVNIDTPIRLTVAALGLALLHLSAAAAGAQDFTYATNDGTITITGYTGAGGALTIPDIINGCSSRLSGTVPSLSATA